MSETGDEEIDVPDDAVGEALTDHQLDELTDHHLDEVAEMIARARPTARHPAVHGAPGRRGDRARRSRCQGP